MYSFPLLEANQYARTADIKEFIVFEAIPKPKLKKTRRKSAKEQNQKYSLKQETILINSSVHHGGLSGWRHISKNTFGEGLFKGRHFEGWGLFMDLR